MQCLQSPQSRTRSTRIRRPSFSHRTYNLVRLKSEFCVALNLFGEMAKHSVLLWFFVGNAVFLDLFHITESKYDCILKYRPQNTCLFFDYTADKCFYWNTSRCPQPVVAYRVKRCPYYQCYKKVRIFSLQNNKETM